MALQHTGSLSLSRHFGVFFTVQYFAVHLLILPSSQEHLLQPSNHDLQSFGQRPSSGFLSSSRHFGLVFSLHSFFVQAKTLPFSQEQLLQPSNHDLQSFGHRPSSGFPAQPAVCGTLLQNSATDMPRWQAKHVAVRASQHTLSSSQTSYGHGRKRHPFLSFSPL
jgi:hypothetical protein